MTDRGRAQSQDWDLDYDNSNYDPQNPEDGSSGYVNLDHSRLYITNIPRALNDDGLAAAFAKYGTLVECYVNRDPNKRYALVAFETPGEAKAAMMKLNRTEPLNLYVNIAHKSKARNTDSGYRGNSSGTRYREERGYRDDASTDNRSNNNRRQDFMANGDSMDDLGGDHGVLNSSLEPDVNLELEQLKLQHLKLQEEQLLCKQRMLLIKQNERKPSSSTRCIMPDGRIVVRSVDQGDNDPDNLGAGGGDANKIPGLQSTAACVACGERAQSFCGGCRVTPYCTAACQRRDWLARHRRVCHNLKRQSVDGGPSTSEAAPEQILPAVAPLRRPRSPESGSDRLPPRRFGPPGSAMASTTVASAARGNRNSHRQPADNRRHNSSFDDDDRPRSDGDKKEREKNRPRGDRDRNDRPRNQDRNGGRPRHQDGNRQASQPARPPVQDEDWGPPVNRAAKPEPTPAPPAEPARAKPAVPATPAPRLATVADVAPVPKKLTPANCVLELLAIGEKFIISVDGEHNRSWLCTLALYDGPHADNYVKLIDPLKDACEAAETVQPSPGELFAYRDPSDQSWYRARCLGTTAALLDASRVVPLSREDRCARLPNDFTHMPEYCCLLDCSKVKVLDTPECTVVSKSGGEITLSVITEAGPVTAAARRWLPAVSAPAPAAASATASASAPATAPAPAPAKPAVIELPRPAVTNNSTVMLVDATEPERVFVVPAARDKLQEFNDIACEVSVYAADPAVPRLKELPAQGDTVIARFTDGVDYRAFVKRVSTKHKRCLLEYIEYGNIHIEEKLENMCSCPPQLGLAARPTLASMVTLPMRPNSFSASAKTYLDTLKEAQELKLTIPSGAESAASGSAVRLTLQSGEDLGAALEALSSPPWLLLLQRGGDVLEVESLHFNDVEYVEPACGELMILDASFLKGGCVYGHAKGAPHAARAFELSTLMEEYCNSELAKDPYLPKLEELCIAKSPKRQRWVRAVVLEQKGGAGAAAAELLQLDYGSLESVPVAALRKMMPEFVRRLPAAVTSLEIKDFPVDPTPEQLSRASQHMRLTADGRGVLTVTRVTRTALGEYQVEAPDLIRAMQ